MFQAESTFWIGIGAGFLTAILSACAFLFSTIALKKTPGLTAPGLMVNAGLIMGIVSLAGLGIFWNPALLHGFWGRLPSLLGASVFWALGQTFVLAAQRNVESSRVVPLLGLKLPMLALLSLLLKGETFNFWQLLAILLVAAAAFVLNKAGKRIPLVNFVLVMCGCLSYCFSDLSLTLQVLQINREVQESALMASLHCALLCYAMAGVFALLSLPFTRKWVTRLALRNAIPYSVLWVSCIVMLDLTFALLGTVLGVILQNTRAIFAILLTPVFILCGCTVLESKLTPSLFFRRLLAAAMVVLAIFLYNIGH